MKRLFSTENLIEAAIAIIVIIASTVVVYGQEPTPQPPAPSPTLSLTIEGPSEGKRDDYNDFKATGGPENGTYQWLVLPLDSSLKLREFDGGKACSIVGKPGSYTLLLFVSNGSAKQLDQHEFVIPGADPVPPGPPKPVPVVKTLRDLAGPDATKVEKLHADMLEAIGKGLFDTVQRFKDVYAAAVKDRGLENNLAVLECTKRLGLSTLDAIKVQLLSIAEELKTAPAPISGKRQIVIVRESADGTGDFARLILDIRSGEVARYLKEKGHPSPLILDDDTPSQLLTQLAPQLSGVTLPALLVLDPETKAVVYKQTSPEKPSDFIAAIQKGGA